MKTAAVGFRVHSGWTSLGVVALENGEPVVLARQRPHLVQTFSYTFRQPYHTAAKMSLSEAEAFLVQQRRETRCLAVEALRLVQFDVAQQGYRVTRAALLRSSGRPLPELAKVLAAHSLIHTADGEFFREAILHACQRQKLVVASLQERELMAAACSKFRRSATALASFLTELGKPLGTPWSQDEKFAALAAWLVMTNGA